MKLLGSNEDSGVDSGNSRQIRSSQEDAAAVGYGFHPPQESLNEFPAAFVPKRWTNADDLVEVNFSQTHTIKNHEIYMQGKIYEVPLYELCWL